MSKIEAGCHNMLVFQKVVPESPLCILYSSCSQVGHNMIDRVKSLPEQIKSTASIYKHILCDNGSAACSGIDASMQ